MGEVIILPVVSIPRACEAPPDMKLADRTNVTDFPIIFCGLDARMSRRVLRSLLDEGAERASLFRRDFTVCQMGG